MYLHFQDWSDPGLLEHLDDKGLEHGERIIKVFATGEDPREALGRSTLTVVAGNAEPFTGQDVYSYGTRGAYRGGGLELTLEESGLGDLGKQVLRSLFRFSNQHGFCQAAMAVGREGNWLINHPFDDIDGVDQAKRQPRRERALHLDIFFANSLAKLKDVVDYDNPEAVLGMREGARFMLGKRH